MQFAPMQFAPLPAAQPDASGAQAIGGLANMAGLLAQRIGNRPQAGPTDAPPRRKTPLVDMTPTHA
jgi:hypothetical protein